jgi:hypothetical protein
VPADEKDGLWHQSGINQQGEPFVQLLRGEKIIAQMDPEQARDHASAITEAAEAAEQDAFMVHFLREKIGLTLHEAGRVLVEFREWRRDLTGKSSGPTNPRDWVMPEKKAN